jgi:hypothetical protein
MEQHISKFDNPTWKAARRARFQSKYPDGVAPKKMHKASNAGKGANRRGSNKAGKISK